MTNSFLKAGLAIIAMMSGAVGAAEAQQPQPTLVVLDTRVTNDAERVARFEGMPAAVRREIETAIRGSRRFAVLERDAANLSAIFDEQDLAASSFSQSANAPSGQLEAAGYVVLPAITEFVIGAEFTPLDAFPGRYSRRDYATLSVEVRVLDSETGQVLYANEERETYSNTVDAIEGRMGGPGRAVVQRLSEGLGPQLGASVVNYVFPIMVAQVQGNEVFLNRGEGGVAIGEEYDVFRQGDVLIDPATGEPLGGFGATAESLAGRIRITRIAARFSVAEIIDGNAEDFEIGAVARQ